MITDNIVMWVIRLSIVDWVCSKTQILLETLKTPKQPREESCVQETNFNIPQFNGIGSSFLDAGLRKDGIPALDLWDVVIEVLRHSKDTNQALRNQCRKVEVGLPVGVVECGEVCLTSA